MNLDLPTMMVMLSLLALLFAGLLWLAGMHAENVDGVGYWAIASLCISGTMGLALIQPLPSNGAVLVFGGTMIATGLMAFWMGIQVFLGKRYDSRVPWGVIGYVVLQSICFVIIYPSATLRSLTNSMVFALISLACARALLIPMAPPLRTAYWFTGGSFLMLAIVLVVRCIGIIMAPTGHYGLYSPMLINPLTFLATSVVLLCLTFGFVLMINYRLSADLHNLAARDFLTGALNRRSLEEEAERQWARSSRTGEPITVMMLDIDHFKSINDRFGHPVGDDVLRNLAKVVKASIRSDDYFARYGGEEFCILLPTSTEQEVQVLAERLRQSYEAMRMNIGAETLQSTVSIGVADSRQAGFKFESLVSAADQAMYYAKQTGRNRVVTYSQMLAERSV